MSRCTVLHVAYNFTLGTEKSMTLHSLVLAVPCNVCKHSLVSSVGSAETYSENVKNTTLLHFLLIKYKIKPHNKNLLKLPNTMSIIVCNCG